MTRIAIKPEQLDQLASGIQDAERKADEAISDFKWNYQSLLMNITGANTGKIDALQAELQYEMRKYRDKLHDLQAAVKLTERKMTEEDHSLSAKFGLMALKFSGLNKLFQNYDPITGEALSWSERLFGKNPLNASYGGAFGEMFPDLQYALNPKVIQSRMKQTYESVVLDPLSKTTTYLDDVRQDVSHSVVRYSNYVDRWWGETQQKVDEVSNTTWDFMGDVVEGVLDGSGNAVKDTFEGIFHEGFLETIRRLNPVYSVTKDVPKLISLSKSVYEDPKGSFQKVVDVPKYMWQGVKKAWDRDVVNGDASSRTEFFTYGLTTIGIGLLGDKGLSKVGTAAKTIDKVSDAAKRVKIEGNGSQPALAGVSAGAASKGGPPYNVLNDPVSRIKTEIDRVYGGKGSKNKALTVNDYLDEIVVSGKVDATKLNKLKNSIQNNVFSVEELSEIREEMTRLGIASKYDEALLKIDFGKYLRGLIGDPPVNMVNPHAHHILFKKGLGDSQQKLVQEGQLILRKYGIDPIIGKENLAWAPNRISGQHNIDALEHVVNQLRAVDEAGADIDDIIEILEDLGKQAATRK
ncbi:AHH domain-containing protein [Anaerobacillus sp. 1_MG-2023]|uniref:AHH domain-containing protein n=1 Tax=Anaerobacillus sp. 1_MG-2023 TaxID=3062655 RepID=UPI0026E166EE|nr:AHH domain-containing protein [Anaerobacillus sp. 1_MG-2023]MDO6654493.1 AHH domain-containing protein [Anaerobacillus sp. 1_MG-2023]